MVTTDIESKCPLHWSWVEGMVAVATLLYVRVAYYCIKGVTHLSSDTCETTSLHLCTGLAIQLIRESRRIWSLLAARCFMIGVDKDDLIICTYRHG